MARRNDRSRAARRFGIGAVAAAVCTATVFGIGTESAHAASLSVLGLQVSTSIVSPVWGDLLADKTALDAQGKNDAAADPGSLYTIENAIGARTVWAKKDSSNRQITGQGVTVALLDSGTAAVSGLTGAGKLTYGPDLSIESNGVLTDQDTYGHGTHMAGIIAGRDAAELNAKTIPTLSPSVQLGVAPDAKLLSLKLANSDGSTDVSQVIAALNWVTEHQTSADGSKVRVVNLSFGTSSLQPYQLDPLAAAAENAWKHGLVVVVSAGNNGNGTALTDPAIDPYIIAVGASDGSDTLAGWATPKLASFTSTGTTVRHDDLLAPGRSIVSLRDPGSNVDVNHPEGRVLGDSTGRLFRGSGTSQAAAVVSGSVALLLQAYPNLTPDQVKAALMSSATAVSGTPLLAGAGELNVPGALAAAATLASSKPVLKLVDGVLTPVTTQNFPISTGQGSLQAARGGNVLDDSDGTALAGEVDVQGKPWNAAAWWAAASTLTSWSGGNWLGTRWTGDGWATTGSSTESARWSSARWSSARWSDADWSSARWSSARWSSARWSDAAWSAARWSSARWSDSSWG